MPITIPDSPGQQIRTQPRQAQQTPLGLANADAFGAPIARAVGQIGVAAAAIGRDIKADREETARIHAEAEAKLHARNAASEATIEANRLFDEVQSRKGVAALGGKDGPGVTEQLTRDLNELSALQLSSLPNVESQNHFEESFREIREGLIVKASRYESGEKLQAETDSFDNGLAVLESRAKRAAGDAEELLSIAVSTDRLVADRAESLGLDEIGTDALMVETFERIGKVSIDGQLDRAERENPAELYLRLIQGAFDGLITEGEKSQRLKDSGAAAIQQWEDANIAEAVESAQRKKAKDGARIASGEEGDTLAASGQLSRQWIDEHSAELGERGRNRLFGLLAGSTKGEGDPARYEQLVDAAEGIVDDEDAAKVRLDIRAASEAGDIKPGQADKLRTELEKRQFGVAGRRISQALKPSEVNSDPLNRDRYSRAMLDWDLWKSRNPEATQKEALAEAESIINASNVFGISVRRSIAAEALPRAAAAGVRLDEQDVDEILADTQEAFLLKHNGDTAAMRLDPEYNREMRRIEKLQLYIEAKRANEVQKPSTR